MPDAIEIVRLTKSYRSLFGRQSLTALDDVSLSVGEGEVFGYLGSNGAGKTTTIKILLRLARPSHGSVRILGGSPGGHNRFRIGYLPESPYFYDFLTPVELLTFYCRVFGIRGELRRKRISEALERVGMAERGDSTIRNFSKGMTQRVGLAQAMLNDPDVVFLDEPTSGLDPLGRREVRDLILDLKARGKTVFLNSHLLSEVELVCDRVAILKRGRLMRIGTVQQLITQDGVEIVVRATPEALPAGVTGLMASAGPTDPEGSLRLLLDHERDVHGVLCALLENDVPVISVNPRRESLEDVFMRIEAEA